MMLVNALVMGADLSPLNSAPDSCAIAAPTAGFAGYVGQALVVSGTFHDPNNNVIGVEEFNGATSWGAATLGSGTFTKTRTLLSGDKGAVSLTAVATDAGGLTKTSSAVTGTIYAVPAPTSCTPDGGPDTGGTAVTIAGSGFTGATGVTFGGTAATSVVVVSDSSITCVAPAHADGLVDVVVTNPATSGTLSNGYEFDPQPLARWVADA